MELRYGLTNEDGEEMTQKEVADLLGISQSYISRLEKENHETAFKKKSSDLNRHGKSAERAGFLLS